MQDLGSVQYLYYLLVTSFLIDLRLRTMQDHGFVQYLYFLVTSFPIGLSLRTMQDLGSV